MAKSADTEQQTLMGMLIHDARGPLSCITLALDAVASGGLDVALLAMTRAQLRQLTELVEDMGSLHQNGSLPARLEQVDLGQLLHSLAADVARAHPALRIDVDVDVSAATLSTDPVGVRRVVENLLRNAARHASAQVRVRLDAHEGQARVVVEDDGEGLLGIAPEALFDLRARGEGSDGQGLGLAIARMIATRLGDDVRYVGGGPTRFELDIPRAPEPVSGHAAE